MGRLLTVKALMEQLSKMDPKAFVVVPGTDHSYSNATVSAGEADYYASAGWFETPGDDPPIDDGRRFPVVIIE